MWDEATPLQKVCKNVFRAIGLRSSYPSCLHGCRSKLRNKESFGQYALSSEHAETTLPRASTDIIGPKSYSFVRPLDRSVAMCMEKHPGHNSRQKQPSKPANSRATRWAGSRTVPDLTSRHDSILSVPFPKAQ